LLQKNEAHKLPSGAANRFPDKVDKDPEGTKALNITATRTLARLCAARSILMIYISTDYVFPGRPGEAPYDVDAEPSPTNLYGETKLGGERAMLEEFERAGKRGWGVVLRVPVLYGEAEVPEESAVNVLLNAVWGAARGGEKVRMDNWAVRYPTNTEDVARVVAGRFISSLFSQDRRVFQKSGLTFDEQTLRRNTSIRRTSRHYRASSTSRARTKRRNMACANSSDASWGFRRKT